MIDRRMHAEHDAEKWFERYRKVLSERNSLAAELAEVLDYAGHKDGCVEGMFTWNPRTLMSSPAPCTCGWTAMRERHAKGKA